MINLMPKTIPSPQSCGLRMAQAAPPDIIELMLSSPSAAQAAKDATREGMDVGGLFKGDMSCFPCFCWWVFDFSLFYQVFKLNSWRLDQLPSGKRLHNYGKSPFLMGKSTLNCNFSVFVEEFFHINSYINDLPKSFCRLACFSRHASCVASQCLPSG